MEVAVSFSRQDFNDNLTIIQWATIKQAREQIKNGDFKTYESVKEHFCDYFRISTNRSYRTNKKSKTIFYPQAVPTEQKSKKT